mmetsp:Transcript_122807/g.262085  ORF Transcript_122807/g.262085 Transcript_122807/m.262085 type:complete len:191 (+) Transcript_122807:51-623(+)
MAADPAKDDEIWKNTCSKEMMAWQSPQTMMKSMTSMSTTSQDFGNSFYRVPMQGEPVTVSGMRRRPELNGAQGEIVNSALDEFGRVTVRVFDNSANPGAGGRKMKIQPFRLVPSSSAPSLPSATGGLQDDRSSVRSCSRAGSVLSGAGRSSVNSALGKQRLRTGTPAVRSTGQLTPMQELDTLQDALGSA